MSSADRRSSGPSRDGQRGYTFVETVVVLGLVSMLGYLVERTLASATEAERMLGATRTAVERGQRLAYEVRDEIAASRKIFGDDAVGQEYFDALDVSRDPMLPTARLPRFDETGVLGPDEAGEPHTGNVLFFVRESDALPCMADPATKKMRMIDTYRFVCVYPSPTSRSLITGGPLANDLVVWRSVPYPNLSQIEGISDPGERTSVVRDIHDRFGLDVLWDPNQPASAAFRTIDGAGNIAGTPIAAPSVDEDMEVSRRGRLVYAKLQLAPTDMQTYHRRAIFTVDLSTWEPEGFEIKVVGASGARKVWLHLVVETQAAAGRVVVHPSTLIVSAKDL
jgi:hypothetical protein